MIASAAIAALVAGATRSLLAQAPQVHYQNHAAMPPGAIGSWQLQRGGPIGGYFQPVQFRLPSGAKVGLAAGGQFTDPLPTVTAGFLIGQVYRLRVTNIPSFDGEEVYPTLEVIDRTYPPPGYEARYPIVIEIAFDDLELAIGGRFVTRVIYLENPQGAFPRVENPKAQEWFDVPPGHDPLQAADALGRPVAILRMGGRTPSNTAQPDLRFLYGCPPFKPLPYIPGPPEMIGAPQGVPGNTVPPVPTPQGNQAQPGSNVPPAGSVPMPQIPAGDSTGLPPRTNASVSYSQPGPAGVPWQQSQMRPPIENSALLPAQYQTEPRILR